jgi:cytochrome c oxidase assembly protein subunit 11
MTGPAVRKNRLVLIALFGVVAAMVGGAYAAVPLYRVFCQVTGYGGTTNVAEKPSDTVSKRVMTIRFDATVNGVPWVFQPVRRSIRTHVGETTLAFYRAKNQGSVSVTGSATFNVTPLKAGQYFSKIDCFCFSEQHLEPGQVADMPVTFFVDPAIENDRNLDDVTTITLSYTFYPVEDQRQEKPKSVSRLNAETPVRKLN